ncbi:MAG: DinB family protein [Vicinamibacteraceae bacterium]
MPNTTPDATEASEYYFQYINLVPREDVRFVLAAQQRAMQELFRTISDEQSTHRYAADKWSIRQVVGHLNDCERVFTFRALWFARGFDSPLPSFNQDVAAQRDASAHRLWSSLIEEFHHIRASTISFFTDLPPEAWSKRGIANEHEFTVRALAHIIAGHVNHHATILSDRYLRENAR